MAQCCKNWIHYAVLFLITWEVDPMQLLLGVDRFIHSEVVHMSEVELSMIVVWTLGAQALFLLPEDSIHLASPQYLEIQSTKRSFCLGIPWCMNVHLMYCWWTVWLSLSFSIQVVMMLLQYLSKLLVSVALHEYEWISALEVMMDNSGFTWFDVVRSTLVL